MFSVDLGKGGVSSFGWILKLWSEFDFSRSSVVDGVCGGVILSMLAAPGNVVVAMSGGNDDDGVLLVQGINFVLSIASGFKGQIPV